ncbi:hypothetical protein U27_02423 [Candidatus Vecturithrix granuli]|uniref:MITD1 C-terminal phospholipase D-like domain-containing protein n=1 Tax=Vecturithrix granuli TaxID=1499967 RepID=A0A0S6W7B6_VECG1|nr:hypothetical protein U27_02423 [Candidatus Vecturithrix granuli]
MISSFSMLSILKRTLLLYGTVKIDDLVEEVHKHMLANSSLEQIKTRYVLPILRNNPSFVEVENGNNVWQLTKGNKLNDVIYDILKKYRSPLSERQILNRLAKEKHLATLSMVIDLKNDPRFSDIEGGKYWILTEWIVINEYARSILLKLKSSLSEKELVEKVIETYRVDPELALFLPMFDESFIKKDGRWTLKKFVERKSKLRASQIDRLYNSLQEAGESLTSDELTASVFNIPAQATDIDECLAIDPRFLRVNGKWSLKKDDFIPQNQPIINKIESIQKPIASTEQQITTSQESTSKIVDSVNFEIPISSKIQEEEQNRFTKSDKVEKETTNQSISEQTAWEKKEKRYLKERHFRIVHNETGHTYESIFGEYLKDAKSIIIEDPYIRVAHQIQNLTRPCELIVTAGTIMDIKLITGYKDDEQKTNVTKSFLQLKNSLANYGINFNFEFSKTLHDRQIQLDNGWVIKIGRGLDFYRAPESRFSVGAIDMKFQYCLETNVDIFKIEDK